MLPYWLGLAVATNSLVQLRWLDNVAARHWSMRSSTRQVLGRWGPVAAIPLAIRSCRGRPLDGHVLSKQTLGRWGPVAAGPWSAKIFCSRSFVGEFVSEQLLSPSEPCPSAAVLLRLVVVPSLTGSLVLPSISAVALTETWGASAAPPPTDSGSWRSVVTFFRSLPPCQG